MSEADDRRARKARAAAEVDDHIRRFGCHVISVVGGDDGPSFSYSTGLGESAGVAEAIVIGVRPSLGKSMIDAYQEFVLAGVRFEAGKPYDGFLGGGFQVYVEPVPIDKARDFMFATFTHYADRPFSVVQIVYPTVQGVWPWEDAATASFVAMQPLLGRPRPDAPA